MTHNDAASDRTESDGRNPFEKFVESVYGHVSGAPFFFVCVALVLVWLASVPLWVDLKSWQVAIHTVTSVISLLLLVLLENAGRRAEEAAQEKLNVIAEALAELMESHSRDDEELREATTKLRQAIRLEERH